MSVAVSPLQDGFAEPDFSSSLDVQEHVALASRDATVKGAFLRGALRVAEERRGEPPELPTAVKPFRNYSAGLAAEVLAACAEHAFPHVSLREALRRVGRTAYPTLVESSVGKVLLALTDMRWETALELVSRAYAVAGTARVTVKLGDREALVQLRNLWTFADSYHVGVFEGAMDAFRVDGPEIGVRVLSPCDVDLRLRWS